MTMDIKTFSEVGVAAAALYIVFKLGSAFLDGYFKEKTASREAKGGCDPNIIEVIQNNTKVMDKLSDLMNKLLTGQREQAVQMEELLARAREQK